MTSLPAAATGERIEFDSPAGRLAAFVDGPVGAPVMLLVHSVNAAGSAAEVAPVHRHYLANRRVVSLDLPGFGASERSDRPYTPRLMTDAVLATLEEVHRRGAHRGPVDALGLSLGSEFVARAATEQPELFRTVALVSPTGLDGRGPRRGPPGSTRYMPVMDAVLRGPGWGGALFRGLTRPSVIRYFLKRTYGTSQIDEDLWRFDTLTTRQPGAEFAPLSFLSGRLFSDDVTTLYESLALPVWVCHGVRGDFTDYRGLAVVHGKPNWRITVLQTGALPHFEQPAEFFAAYDEFLASAT